VAEWVEAQSSDVRIMCLGERVRGSYRAGAERASPVCDAGDGSGGGSGG